MSTKPCKYCASEIPTQATLCPTCRSYQSTWRNVLLYAAGLTGFATLVASAVAFTAHEATETYKKMFWNDKLNVLELQTGPPPYLRVIMSNDGDGPVFASGLDIYWQGSSASFPIDRVVSVNTIEILDNLQVASPDSAIKRYGDYQGYFGNDTGLPSAEVLSKSGIFGPAKCFFVPLFDSKNAELARMRDHYSKTGLKFVTGPATATLWFFSSHTGSKKELPIQVLATFLVSSAPNCRSTSHQ